MSLNRIIAKHQFNGVVTIPADDQALLKRLARERVDAALSITEPTEEGDFGGRFFDYPCYIIAIDYDEDRFDSESVIQAINTELEAVIARNLTPDRELQVA